MTLTHGLGFEINHYAFFFSFKNTLIFRAGFERFIYHQFKSVRIHDSSSVVMKIDRKLDKVDL